MVLSQVLACDATLGFEDVYDIQLKCFNGTPLRNLRHLAELVQANKEPFMRFDLSYEVGLPSVYAVLAALLHGACSQLHKLQALHRTASCICSCTHAHENHIKTLVCERLEIYVC